MNPPTPNPSGAGAAAPSGTGSEPPPIDSVGEPATLGEEYENLARGLRHAIARERRRGRRRVAVAPPPADPRPHQPVSPDRASNVGATPPAPRPPSAPMDSVGTEVSRFETQDPTPPASVTQAALDQAPAGGAPAAGAPAARALGTPGPKRSTPAVSESARAAARAARALLNSESSAAPGPERSGDADSSTPAAPEGIRTRAAACPDLDSLAAAVASCTACALCEGRTQTVFADGLGTRGVAFVGEAPGFHEDQQGIPFVGPAGQLLSDIITKGMGLRREEVFICNVLKCRPPGNRDPLPGEKELCTPWLDRQLELIGARVVIPLGRHAAGHLLGSQAALGRLRGRVHERRGRKIIPTYHPAYLLRNPADKKECWKDIQLAMAELGLPKPGPS